MSIQRIVIHRYNADQPQPLLEVTNSSKNRFAEFAGGTTAECAVVCCCIPLSLVNLFFMAVYGVPAGLVKKAMRKKRRRKLLRKGLLIDDGYDDRRSEVLIGVVDQFMKQVEVGCGDVMDVDGDVIRLENEMWGRFYGTGFWRSGSQRGD